ncbi:MAG: hypothetical protein J6U10_04390 [Lachnospiraceae bacterium]|nr:hypothetical protein [Lachnospiraceae bacterium]
MKKDLFRKLMAGLLCMMLVLGNMPAALKTSGAGNDGPLFIPGGEYEPALNVYYGGAIADFTLGDGRLVSAADIFTGTATIPLSLLGGRGTNTPYIYLLPYARNTPEGFVEAYKENFRDCTNEGLFYVRSQKRSVTTSSGIIKLEADELVVEGNITSGLYVPYIIFYDLDPIVNRTAEMDVTLFSGAYPICVSNPADGGFKGDPSEYIPQRNKKLDVSVKLDGEYRPLESATVIVYSEDLSVCYGISPCLVPCEKVALYIDPGAAGKTSCADYNFPERSKGNACVIDVPADGYAEVTIYKYSLQANIDGTVCTSNGSPAEGAIVSCSTAEGRTLSTKTDKNGRYSFYDVTTEKAVDIYASKGAESFAGEVGEEQLKTGKVNYDITLKGTQPELFLSVTGAADEVNAAVASGLLDGSIRVTDGNRAVTDGYFRLENGNTLAFYPNAGSSGSDSYKVYISDQFIAEEEISVSKGGTAVLTCEKTALLKAEVTSSQGFGYPHFLFYDENGLAFETVSTTRKAYELISVPEEEKQYSVLVYMDPSPEYTSLSREEAAEQIPGATELTCVAGAGKVVDLGTVESAFHVQSDLGPLSYMSAVAVTNGDSKTIKVTGHMETAGNLVINAVRAYGYGLGSSENNTLLTAGYKDRSLVINKKNVKASLVSSAESFYDVGRLIELEAPAGGPADFSLILDRFSDRDMMVRVAADVTIDGEVKKNVTIGETMIYGVPVTLSTRSSTADGYLNVSGTASPFAKVFILDGETVIGSAEAGLNGAFELGVQLLTIPGYKSTHSIKARSNGYTTDAATVISDPEGTSVVDIYFTENGKELPKTYTWTKGSKFVVNAVVTGDRVDKAYFTVLCSNGTTMRVEAEYKDTFYSGNRDRHLYSSEEINFGKLDLCPIKVYFESSTERKPFEPVTTVSINAGTAPTKEQLDRLDEAYGAQFFDGQPDNVEGKLIVITESLYIGKNDFERLKAASSSCALICDDNGNERYETFGYFEHQSYFLCTHDIYADTYSVVMNRYIPADMEFYEGILMPDGEVASFAGDTVIKTAVIGAIGDQARDIALDALNPVVKGLLMRSAKTAPLAWITDYVGVGDLYTIYQRGAAAVDYNRKSAQADNDRAMLSFFTRAAMQIDDKVDTRKLNGSVSNAISDLNRANEMQCDALGQSVALSLANWAIQKGGPEIAAIGKATELISGPMMEEINAHSASAWSYAQQSVTEAMREFQLLTGLTKDAMLQLYKDYADGKISDYYIQKILEESIKNKKPVKDEDSEEFEPIIDPSGIVYEAVLSNVVEGATVTLYRNGNELFEAADYGQVNPLTSDGTGRYAWDVPEGNWFVRVYKDGYLEGSSDADPNATVAVNGLNCLPVLPPQLDVNIPLASPLRPMGSLQYENGGWYLVFDKYVQTDTVTTGNIGFSADGFKGGYAFEAVDGEVSPSHTPVCGGKLLATKFKVTGDAAALSAESKITLTVSDNVLGYNGKAAGGSIIANGGTGNGKDPGQKEPTGKPGKGDREPERGINLLTVILIIAGVGTALVIAGVVTAVVVTKKKKAGKG